MKEIIIDSETDGLEPSRIWCISTRDIATGEKLSFVEEQCYKDFPEYTKTVDKFIGHNLLGFDAPIWNRLLGTKIPLSKIEDTLVLSRLANPVRPGGHSIAAWAGRFGKAKQEHEDWSVFSPEMLSRCETDVEINYLVWKRLKQDLKRFSQASIDVEHSCYHEIKKLESNGFYFDVRGSQIFQAELREKAEKIKKEIHKHFRPITKELRVVEPKYRADGEISVVGLKKLGYEDPTEIVAGPFSLFEYEEFNLGSPSQIVKRLNKLGWKPTERTDGGKKAIAEFKRRRISKEERDQVLTVAWKISEKNLLTIPDTAPESAKSLRDWKILTSRVNMIDQWLDAVGPDQRLRGVVNSCGAITTRMTHQKPNTGNIVSVDSPYGTEIRSFWTVEPGSGRVLVGMDQDQLELRMLAHYMDDEEFTRAIIEGDKEKGTDPHSIFQRLWGFETRKQAKTEEYALIYGAGDAQLGYIAGGNAALGKKNKELVMDRFPGLEETIATTSREAEKTKRVKLIDGSYAVVRKRNAALNTKLQGGGARVCKWWLKFIREELRKQRLDPWLAASVHDEYQWDSLVEQAELLGQIGVEAAVRVGEFLDTTLPLAADYKIGKNWAETH